MRAFTLWLWIAALLTSTVGISVTQIYCYCVGESTYSIFQEAEDACAANQAPTTDACCEKDAPACCAEKGVKSEDDHDCTKKTVKVFQMKVDFLIGHPLEKMFDCPLWVEELPEYVHWYHPALCSATPNNKAPPAPPPPLSGRMICVRHELFRC